MPSPADFTSILSAASSPGSLSASGPPKSAIASVKKGVKTAVGLARLPGKVTPHTLRHTAATWLMQRGVPIWEAAGVLGMSPEVLQNTYGHHHPDYLQGAASAIGQKGPERFGGRNGGQLRHDF
jgi:integrase